MKKDPTTQEKRKSRQVPMPENLKNLPRITVDEQIKIFKKLYNLTDEEEQEIRDELD